jgi:hypothetical protein
VKDLRARSGIIPLIVIKLKPSDDIGLPREQLLIENSIHNQTNENAMPPFLVAFDEKLSRARSPQPDVSLAVSFLIILLITSHFQIEKHCLRSVESYLGPGEYAKYFTHVDSIPDSNTSPATDQEISHYHYILSNRKLIAHSSYLDHKELHVHTLLFPLIGTWARGTGITGHL